MNEPQPLPITRNVITLKPILPQPPEKERFMSTDKMRTVFAALRVPAIPLGLLLIPCTFYFLHVRAQKEYLKNRNFRLLATLSDQIKSKINSYQSVIAQAAKEATEQPAL